MQTGKILDFDWCSIVHVEGAEQPLAARFCRAQHTLLIFDCGSYLYGQRAIDGTRMSGSGPMDGGVDVVPASAEFLGIAESGSKVGCTFISIDPDQYGGEDAGYEGDAWTLNPAVGLTGTLIRPLAGRLRQISNATDGDWHRLYVESAVTMLFHEVRDALRQSKGTRTDEQCGGLTSRAQRLVREFLLENIDKKVDLQTLAAHVGLSRCYFSRAFKKSFGMPPYHYLLELRINKAAELLRQTKRPITDVGLDVGFAGPGEFSRAFRQLMGCTPRQFRAAAA